MYCLWVLCDAHYGALSTANFNSTISLPCGTCGRYGRLAGTSASQYMLSNLARGGAALSGSGPTTVTIEQGGSKIEVKVSGSNSATTAPATAAATASAPASPADTAAAAAQAAAPSGPKIISMEEVKKHNSNDDCWVVVDGGVYDVTDVSRLLMFVSINTLNVVLPPSVIGLCSTFCLFHMGDRHFEIRSFAFQLTNSFNSLLVSTHE